MEAIPIDDTSVALDTLPYDEVVPYEEQLSTTDNDMSTVGSLASRMSRTKVYLLSESAAPRATKVRALSPEGALMEQS
jgi:hypothetical protein